MFADYPKLQVYACSFQMNIHQAHVSLKFPCQLFVEWKTSSGKKYIASQNRVRIVNSVATFNQSLHLQTQVMFDQSTDTFLKKQSILLLNLISKTRPEPKLIGRVTINLSDVINSQNPYREVKQHILGYCSAAGAAINFNVVVVQKRLLDKDPRDVQRDSFSEHYSFVGGKGYSRQRSVDSQHVTEPRGQHKTKGVDIRKVDQQRKFIRSSIIMKHDEDVPTNIDKNQSQVQNLELQEKRNDTKFDNYQSADKTKDWRDSRSHLINRQKGENNNLLGSLTAGRDKQYSQLDREKLRQKIRERLPERKTQDTKPSPQESAQMRTHSTKYQTYTNSHLSTPHSQKQQINYKLGSPNANDEQSIQSHPVYHESEDNRKDNLYNPREKIEYELQQLNQRIKTLQQSLTNQKDKSKEIGNINVNLENRIGEEEMKRKAVEKQLFEMKQNFIRQIGQESINKRSLEQDLQRLKAQNNSLRIKNDVSSNIDLLDKLNQQISKNEALQQLNQKMVDSLRSQLGNMTYYKKLADDQLNALRMVVEDHQMLNKVCDEANNNLRIKHEEVEGLKSQIQQLKITILNQQGEKETLERELQSAGKEREEIEVLIKNLQEEYNLINEQNMALKFELSDLKQELQLLKETPPQKEIISNFQQESQITQLKEKLSALQIVLKSKEAELQTSTRPLEKELATLYNFPKSNVFPSQISAIQEHGDEYEQLTHKVVDLEMKIQALKQEKIEANQMFLDVDTKCLNFTNQVQIMKNQITALELQKQELGEQCLNLSNETQILKDTRTALELEKNQMSIQLTKLQSRIRSLEQQKQIVNYEMQTSLNQKLQALEIEKQELLIERDTIIAQRNNAISDRQGTQNEIEKLKPRIQQLESRVGELQENVTNFQQDKQILFTQNWKYEEEMGVQLKKIKRKESQIRGLETQIFKLTKTIEDFNEKLSLGEEERLLADQTMKDRDLQYKKVIKELQGKILILQKIQIQLDLATKEATRLTIEVEDLKRTIDSMNELEVQKNSQISILNRKLISLQHDTIQLQKMNQNLMGSDRNLASKLQEAQQKGLRSKEQVEYLTSQITDLNTKLQSEIIKVQEYQEKLMRYSQKEIRMRVDINILEEESKKIFQMIKLNEQTEENYEIKIQQKNTIIEILKNGENQLHDSLEIAKKTIDQYNTRRKQFEKTIDTLNQKLVSEQSKLSTADSNLKYQSQSLQGLESTISGLQREMKTKQGKILKLEQAIDERQTEYKELLDQFTKLNMEKEELINSQKAERDDLESFLTDQFKIKEDTLLARVDELSIDRDRLDRQLREIKNQRDGLALQIESLKFQINEFEETLNKKINTIDTLQIKVKVRQNENQSLSIQKTALQTELDDFKTKVIQHSNCIDELKGTIKHLTIENTNLTDRLSGACSKMENQQRKTKQNQLHISELEIKNGEDQQLTSQLQEKIIQNQAYILRLENIKEGAESDSQRVQQQLLMQARKLEIQLDDAYKEITAISDLFQAANDEKQNLASSLNNTQTQLNSKTKQLQHKISQIKQLEHHNTQLQYDKSVALQSCQQATNKYVDLNADINMLQGTIAELQATLQVANNNLNSKDQIITELNSQLTYKNSLAQLQQVQIVNTNNELQEKHNEVQQQHQILIQALEDKKIIIATLNAELQQLKFSAEYHKEQSQDLQAIKELYQKLKQDHSEAVRQNILQTRINEQLKNYIKKLEQKLTSIDSNAANLNLVSVQSPIVTQYVGSQGIDPKVHQQLLEQLNSIQESMKELQECNFDLTTQNQDLQEQLNNANIEKDEMQDRILRIQTQLIAITEERKTANQEKRQLQIKTQNLLIRIEELEHQNRKLDESHRILQDKLIQINIEMTPEDTMNQKLKQKQDFIVSLKSEIENLSQQVLKTKSLEEDNNNLMKELQGLQEDLFAFNSADNDKAMQIDSLTHQNTALKEAIQKMKRSLTEGQEIIFSQEERIHELSNIVNNLSNQETNSPVYIASYPLGRQQYEGQQDKITYHSSPDHVPLAAREMDEKKYLQARITELSKQLLNTQQQYNDSLMQAQPNNQKRKEVLYPPNDERMKDLANQLEEHKNREIEQMNTLLDLKIQLSQASQEKEKLKKELTQRKRSVDIKPDIKNNLSIFKVYTDLFTLLEKRIKRQEIESIVQIMIGNKANLEQRMERLTEERGVIQEKARTVSMQFQKLKSFILKGKLSHQQKSSLLSQVKPPESVVNQIVKLSETLADMQYTGTLME